MLSRDAIDACYVALLTGLWADMEAIVGLHYTEDAFGPGAPERVGLRVEALLLEIDLLRGRSEWMQRQGRLAAGHADMLRVMLAELEELLDQDTLENPVIRQSAPIVRAQSRLFDELRRAECCALPQRTIPELPRVHPAERPSQA